MTREKVLAEIEGWRQEGDGWMHHLANFYLMLPCKLYGKGSWLAESSSEKMDVKYTDFVAEANRPFHSLLFLDNTPRKLLQTIWQTIEETDGVSLEKVEELTSVYVGLQREFNELNKVNEKKGVKQKENKKLLREAMVELYEYVLPVYVALRVMGYSEVDLSA